MLVVLLLVWGVYGCSAGGRDSVVYELLVITLLLISGIEEADGTYCELNHYFLYLLSTTIIVCVTLEVRTWAQP